VRPFDGRRVLLIVSGGIAAYKAAYLCRSLRQAGAQVDVILTAAGEHFVGRVTFEALTGRPVHRDVWDDPLGHVALGRETDVAVVAPATADIVARIASGLADDMATATLLAADCPLLVCPAMNTRMWEHPATRRNIETLRKDGVRLLGPDHGELAEAEVGFGRMADPERILAAVGRLLEPSSSAWSGRRVVVTAGPTRAPIDAVRFISNHSSGRMGFALAEAAWRRGADVVLIAGPTEVAPPDGPRLIGVETAAQMLEAMRAELVANSVLVMAAAVGDYRVDAPFSGKIKRDSMRELELDLQAEKDLLTETRELREELDVYTLGFALETEDAVENGRRKLEKGIEMIAVNVVGPDTGFRATTNRLTIISAAGDSEEWPLLEKQEAAERLLDRIESSLPDVPS
jgi:phosphopantothenoylcysteine decarboxylase/phosphopantothenate--cysteine ligase